MKFSRKFKILFICELGIIALLVSLMNPSKSDFIKYMERKSVLECSSNYEKSIIIEQAPKFYEETSKCHNYLLFSVYNVNAFEIDIKVIGFLNGFHMVRYEIKDTPEEGVQPI